MVFFALMCRKCGRWGVKEVRKLEGAWYTCHYCNKRKKLKKAKELGLSMNFRGPYTHPRDCCLVVKHLNKGDNEWE